MIFIKFDRQIVASSDTSSHIDSFSFFLNASKPGEHFGYPNDVSSMSTTVIMAAVKTEKKLFTNFILDK